MKKNNLESLRTGKEFLNYALSNGASVRWGKGSHAIVKTDLGSCVIPVHPGDLGKGLRCKILKLFAAIGLASVVMILIGTI